MFRHKGVKSKSAPSLQPPVNGTDMREPWEAMKEEDIVRNHVKENQSRKFAGGTSSILRTKNKEQSILSSSYTTDDEFSQRKSSFPSSEKSAYHLASMKLEEEQKRFKPPYKKVRFEKLNDERDAVDFKLDCRGKSVSFIALRGKKECLKRSLNATNLNYSKLLTYFYQ
jgi:hypothetical protein